MIIDVLCHMSLMMPKFSCDLPWWKMTKKISIIDEGINTFEGQHLASVTLNRQRIVYKNFNSCAVLLFQFERA